MSEITQLQTTIMLFVKDWAETKKTIIPQAEIIKALQSTGVKSYSTLNGIKSLIVKGYIRKAYSPNGNRTHYVMIRNISAPV